MKVEVVVAWPKGINYTELRAGDVFKVAAMDDYAGWFMSLGNGNHVNLRTGNVHRDIIFSDRPLLRGKITNMVVEV